MLLVPKAVADLLGVEGQSHALHSPEALVLSQLGALLEHGLGHALAPEAAAVDTMGKLLRKFQTPPEFGHSWAPW